MEYIKIPIICLDAILALTGPERGRLLGSLLRYIQGLQGSEEGAEEPRGNEYSLYLVLKAQIDRDHKERVQSAERKRKSRAKCDMPGQSVTSCDMPGQSVTSCDPPSSFPSPPTPPVSFSPPPKEKPPKGGKKKVPQSPPTVEEVQAYCAERNNQIDPEAFVDYYTARGWKYGQGKPVVDWKAAVRTWERRNSSSAKGDSEEEAIDNEEIKRRVAQAQRDYERGRTGSG